MATVHIIGAGISGLSAALALSEAHVPVKLYEASAHAGGRCRSSQARGFGRIDHGLHLFSGAAHELWRFIDRIGSRERFVKLAGPWRVHDGAQDHAFGWRHLPALPLGDAVRLVTGLLGDGQRPFDQLIDEQSPFHDLWLAPLARLALLHPNASISQARALLGRQLRRGAGSFYMARDSLQESFIEPALQQLEYQGGSIYFGQALQAVRSSTDGVSHLQFARKSLPLTANDVVVVATPAPQAKALLQLPWALEQQSSITLHFAVTHREAPCTVRLLTQQGADLVRYDADAMRVTIRHANHAWHGDDALLAARLWRRLQTLHPYLRATALPDWSIWREKRAGHVPTLMPQPPIALPPRLLLAGDWVVSHRPPSLEHAAASGHRAAQHALALLGRQPLRQQ